jgi:hypothetical protein
MSGAQATHHTCRMQLHSFGQHMIEYAHDKQLFVLQKTIKKSCGQRYHILLFRDITQESTIAQKQKNSNIFLQH